MAMDPELLLAGPRGRRLCLEYAIAGQHAAELHTAVFYAAYDLDPGRGTSVVLFGPGAEREPPPHFSADDVAELLAAVSIPEPDERTLLLSLTAAVDGARYWQPPDGEDVLAAAPELQAPLARVAAAIAGSPHAAWWTSPLDRDGQWSVHFAETPSETGARTAEETLNQWRLDQLSQEAVAERDRPADVHANWSGEWWSTPPARLTQTSRAWDGTAPVGLRLVEDRFNWEAATARRIELPASPRVFEIDGPQAWADLCGRYPLELTASRRHDWYRTTGREGRWVIPDWSRVAQDFDAVHLTVSGYLATAGRAITVASDLASVLAGWGPDQTYWLTETGPAAPDQQKWILDPNYEWMLSDPQS